MIVNVTTNEFETLLATHRVPKVRPSVLWAANWWATNLITDDLPYWKRAYRISDHQRLLFREVLALDVDDKLDASEQVELRVDYNPSAELHDAALAAGMVCPGPGRIRGWRSRVDVDPYLFPNKTTMFVRPESVRLTDGYGAPLVEFGPQHFAADGAAE